ncbi:protein-L-isoaspartate O-methyltransferase family protein [Acidocella sp.]|uniref:protein-L-isoaspartate O-methyltransferase family protein n=1 Tax=Acidocella sp. TaxID=50710 RepID=UPI003CFF4C17
MADTDSLAVARDYMVDSQVRPNHVHDLRITGAMRVLPREAFIPAGGLAYADADLPLGGGRYMLKPMVAGQLAQLTLEKNPAHVLVVGAGSGYLAAVLSLAGVDVVALEEETRLMGTALAAHAPQVQAVTGTLEAGWPAGGPYDAIVIEGAVLDIPPALAAQLAPGGRVIAILADEAAPGGLGRIAVAEPAGGGYAHVELFDCTSRLLPQFAPAPAFCF